MEREKYLPIGTVVMLKGGTKRLMITGFCTVADNNAKKVFDYNGCLYPEGIISSKQSCLFDHSQIEKIYYVGLEDEEEKNFKSKLTELMAKSQEIFKLQQSGLDEPNGSDDSEYL